MLRAVAGITIGTIVLWAATVASSGEPAADAAPEERLLLLRTGRVLHGRILRDGSDYEVTLPHGVVRLPATQVELCCASLAEAYVHLSQKVRPEDINQRVRLARWCLQHELRGYAAEQLSLAIQVDPRHPLIEQVERELRLRPSAPVAAASPPTSSPVPTDIELDRLVRGMPEGTVEWFTNQVQPLLLNSCAAASCHGPRSQTAWRLLDGAGRSPLPRRLTQRNLHATLPWIDQDSPQDSPLLERAREPHGNSQTAIFAGPEVAGYQLLAQWVRSVAADTTAEVPRDESLAGAASQQNAHWLSQIELERQRRVAGLAPGEQPAAGRYGAATRRWPLPTNAAHLEGWPGEAGLTADPFDEAADLASDWPTDAADADPATGPPGAAGDDPFDPSLFNRRYHGRR